MERSMLKSHQLLQLALDASQKAVTIQIAQADLTTLKDSNYKLCFAKKMAEGEYNVVWQSYDKFLTNNTFSWTPMYGLFGSNSFKSNIQVDVSTNTQTIGLGEQAILDASGYLNAPTTGGPETSITMLNEYGNIHPGVNQLSTGIDGSTSCTPIYVAPNVAVMGQTTLTPVEKVMVWFEQNIETSTMFSTTRSNSIEIDLTIANSASRKYIDGKWITI